MAKKSSQRYLSGRVKITKNVSLSTDRHLYVEPGEVEPNLGYPGERDVPVSDTYYRLITIPNGTVYDRYWQEDSPAELVEGISIFDESILVGTANSISKIDFIGAAVSATANVGGSIATVTVYSPGSTGQVLFNKNNDFSAATDLFYDSVNKRVGIGTSAPTQQLHLQGSLRITGNIHDENNVVGVANSILIATGTGISWTSSVSSRVEVGPTPPGNAQQGDLWWDNEEGDLNVYYEDVDSGAWVSTNANSQEDDSLWELDAIGIHTTKNVGIGTTIASSALAVGGNAIFKGTGIVTATEFHGTFFGPGGGEISVGAGGTWGVSSSGIHTSKNVGIGSTLPSEPLDVIGTIKTEQLKVTGISTFVEEANFNSGTIITGICTIKDSGDGVGGVGEGGPFIFRDGGKGPDIVFHSSENTLASPTASGDGDHIGNINFAPHDGTEYIRMASINAKINGTVSTGNVPTELLFRTGSTVRTERLRITHDGNLIPGANKRYNIGSATKAWNNIFSGNIKTEQLKVTGISTFASVELDSTLVDIHNNVGLARSVLTSTGAGVSWGNVGANVFIGDNPPSSSVSGDLWWESDTGSLSIRYEDTDSQQWVTITPGSSTFAVPSGGIIIWSGAANAIPTGWVLCDGTNSTPNLRDKFIIGAGNSYNVNDTGTTATGTGGIQYYSLCYIMKS